MTYDEVSSGGRLVVSMEVQRRGRVEGTGTQYGAKGTREST